MNTNCKILLSAFIFIVTVPTTLAENTKKEVSFYKWDEGTQCVQIIIAEMVMVIILR